MGKRKQWERDKGRDREKVRAGGKKWSKKKDIRKMRFIDRSK